MQRTRPGGSIGYGARRRDSGRLPMATHPESKALLRETLEKYIHDLAEELLYWVDELNKLDSAILEGRDPLAAESAHSRWATRTGQAHGLDGGVPASGK